MRRTEPDSCASLIFQRFRMESRNQKLDMSHYKKLLIIAAAVAVGINAYSKKNLEPEYVMEESGNKVTKITDEDRSTVLGPQIDTKWFKWLTASRSTVAGTKKGGKQWSSTRPLAISPDGTELAYLAEQNNTHNIFVRKAGGAGASTQRTFRNVTDFCWGPDGNIYFSDRIDPSNYKIVSIDAHKGSTMRQLTSNNLDFNPYTLDGNTIFFTRQDKTGPSIWSYNKETGELVNCARGYQPTPISKKEFLCTRNSTDGNSEIWLVNYVDGQETLIVSNKEMGFSNPSLSPDGQWILMQGNSKSGKIKNLDLYVIRKDGTQLTQLTYHPAEDFCPVWSADGKQIFFISDRGSKNDVYNIWRMNFNL